MAFKEALKYCQSDSGRDLILYSISLLERFLEAQRLYNEDSIEICQSLLRESHNIVKSVDIYELLLGIYFKFGEREKGIQILSCIQDKIHLDSNISEYFGYQTETQESREDIEETY